MYYLGYDIGSSSVKVALVEAKTGKQLSVLNEPSNEMEIVSLHKDWAEQDPELWWNCICTGTKRIIKEAKIDASKIVSIGISYQMHGLVVVDKNGSLLRNAIIWCDSRAVGIGKKAFEDLGEEFCSKKLLNSPGNFTASKLKWVLDNEPEIYEKIYKYMLPGDYITYKLTGDVSTTKNGLSEGILWNYETNSVANELLAYYGIDKALTPDIVDNFSIQGLVNKKASLQSGLPTGIPVTYRSGDQPNNAMSLNIFKPGEVAATGGTSGVIYAVTDNLKPREVSKVNHFVHVNYTTDRPLIGKLLNINGAGIQFRWLRNLCSEDSYNSMNEKASKVAIGSEGLRVIPFGNGAERMLDNKTVGTHISKLNLNIHNQGHLYRAALEGIAFSFVYGMDILRNDKTVVNVIRAGNDNLFRSEIFSNTIATLIGEDIEIYNTTGAIGAARASGLTDGNFNRFGEDFTKNDHVMTFGPKTDIGPYIEAYENWKKELELILKNT